MNVFIGGEFSGTVRDEFIKRGHRAVSCDFRATERPGPHHEGSWFDPEILRETFDLGIFHPDCTFLTVSGNRWADATWRVDARLAAMHTVRAIWALPNIKKIALENPIGVLSTFWRRPDQVIEPYQFGDPFKKATCLWLRDLPPLVATNDLGAGAQACWKEPPSPERKKNRSRTYQGIAAAMAEQWGAYD